MQRTHILIQPGTLQRDMKLVSRPTQQNNQNYHLFSLVDTGLNGTRKGIRYRSSKIPKNEL